jgi:hypothetical protein
MDSIQTTDISQQIEASKNSAILFPLEGYHHFALTGPDAERYLQGRVTQDLRTLEVGAAATQSMVLTPQGKILGIFLIYKTQDGYRIIAEPGSGENPAEDFKRALFLFKVADQVDCEALDNQTLLYLSGPESAKLIGSPSTDKSFSMSVLTLQDRSQTHCIYDYRGISPSFIISCPKESLNALRNSFGDRVHEGNFEGFTTYRILSGIPEYGTDTSDKIIATEIPHEQSISFKKGCYAGQEVVEMSTARGRPNRQFLHFHSVRDKAFEVDTKIFTADNQEKSCGFISSSVVIPGSTDCYSLGFVKTKVDKDAPIVADGSPLHRISK